MERPRVLLVDDDKDMLECLELALGEAFEAICVASGTEALHLLRTTVFDAVVLDLMMPEIDGITVLSTLRAEGISCPVLLASAMPDLEATARAFGAAGWLSKPYALETLAHQLSQLVHPVRAEPARRTARVTQSDV
jgi:two-component system OmpR family response regulator